MFEKVPEAESPVFNPKKEIKKIKEAPKPERRKLVAEFKKELAEQKEGIADLQEEVIRMIRENPDIKTDELYPRIEEMGKEIKLGTLEKGIAKLLAEKYTKKHEAIETFWNRFSKSPNRDSDMFKDLFGREPLGRIEILKGPMTLYIKCGNPKDYAMLHQQTFLIQREATPEEIGKSNLSGGASLPTSPLPDLTGLINIENVQEMPDPEKSKSTMLHEEQHAFYRLLTSSALEFLPALIESGVTSNDPGEATKQFQEMLKVDLRALRVEAEDKARDEILATMKEPNANERKLFTNLTEMEADDGIYDYLVKARETDIPNLVKHWKKAGLLKNVPDVDATVHESIRQFFFREYYDVLSKGIASFKALTDKLHFSKEKTVAFLEREPLAKWPKVVKRIYAEKKKKSE
ncbi:MAG: Uncharacterized protein G01um101419_122 [Parcubacteria group bacterium Gr01-1014_19]|nr:MAG: Uncharacterized protein G01um101419_122 [Parcubacteria group bacterium Gr01-1014_19]